MVYPEGTWVVDTMTGDLGEVLRQGGGLLALQRPGRGGSWSADPGTVRRATEVELREVSEVGNVTVGHGAQR